MAVSTTSAQTAPTVSGNGRSRLILLLAIAAVVTGGLYWCYLRLSWTVAATSDGAAIALQAQDMLHGNWLLHGWTISDVSFYTTELPEYMLAELARGLGTGTIHAAAAATYTLLVLLAGLVARGRTARESTARGEGVARGLTAAGIMLAPQLGYGAFVLLLSPDHTGTQVPLLLGWLVLDLAPRRWYVPAFLGVLLTWVQVGDRIALLTAAAPLALVCCWRVLRRGPRSRGNWFEVSLAGAALASAAAAEAVARLLAAAGAFGVSPLRFTVSPLLAAHLKMTGEGILELFGANFTGVTGWPGLFFAVTHLAGLIMAGAGFLLALGRCLRSRRDADLVSSVLAVAIVGNVVGYVITVDPGTTIGTGYAAREIAAVLPLGAVLAGRELGPWAVSGGKALARSVNSRVLLRCGLGAALACYAAALGYGAARPAVPGQNSALASWLAARHLTYGLGEVVSNITTVDSGGRVRLAVVSVQGGRVVALHYQSSTSWYDPGRHDATFLVADDPANRAGYAGERMPYSAVQRTFGRPARVYHFSGYTVMTWNHNLLTRLDRA